MNTLRLLLAAATVLVTTRAAAADPSTSERAERLYTEGKALAAAGDLAHACPMFEESQRLEPAIGTQYNLADCYERTGRRATALALFREVVRIAQMSGKQERQRAAEQRAEALEGTVARLRVASGSPPERRTTIDGNDVAADALARGLPVDPGEHVVRIDAPGFISAEKRVMVGGDPSALLSVSVPALDAASAPPTSVPAPEPPVLRPVGLVIAGVGVVGLGIGAVFGLQAVKKKGDAGCNGVDCRQAGASAKTLRDAQAEGTISTVAFIAGGVLAAGGLTLFLVAPRRASSAPSVAPAVSLDSAMIRLRGVF
jgi:hypothetical protein